MRIRRSDLHNKYATDSTISVATATDRRCSRTKNSSVILARVMSFSPILSRCFATRGPYYCSRGRQISILPLLLNPFEMAFVRIRCIAAERIEFAERMREIFRDREMSKARANGNQTFPRHRASSRRCSVSELSARGFFNSPRRVAEFR